MDFKQDLTQNPGFETNPESRIELLKNKLVQLESENKQLENKSVHKQIENANNKEVTNLESKLINLERLKTNLENQLSNSKRQHTNMVDTLEDNLRNISLQESELESHLQKLKFKIPELIELKNKQEKILESMKYRYNDIGRSTIVDLEEHVSELTNNKRHLDERIAHIRKEQNTVTDQLQQRTRHYSIQNTEYESEILKLKSNLKELELIRDDLQMQVEVLQNRNSKAADSERHKSSSLLENLESIAYENEILMQQKSELEKENEYLKKKIKKLRHQLKFFAT